MLITLCITEKPVIAGKRAALCRLTKMQVWRIFRMLSLPPPLSLSLVNFLVLVSQISSRSWITTEEEIFQYKRDNRSVYTLVVQ